MIDIVFDEVFQKKHGKDNSKHGIGKIHVVDGFEIEAISHKIVGVINQVFQQYSGKPAKNTDEQTEKYYKMPILDIFNPPDQ